MYMLTGSLLFLVLFLFGCRKDPGLNAYIRTRKAITNQAKTKSEDSSRVFGGDSGTEKKHKGFFSQY